MSEGPNRAAQPTAAELEQWIVRELSARVGIDPRAFDRRERFNRYGLDSLKAAGFTAELSKYLDRPLVPTLVWDHPTIERLVAHLAPAAGNASTRAPEPQAAPVPSRSIPSSVSEPIAVVGLACRFPMAPDPDAYWRLLSNGVDAIREVPADRWNVDDHFDADVTAPGKMSTRWGGFLDQVDRFDAEAFGISPREVAQIDPQQRLVLELCSEALDDAGVQRDGLRGSPTGVFVGAMWSDYARLQAGAPAAISQHTATGQDTSIIAGRVSYVFGLQGPSLSVNTACSSSLVAIHLACQSLRNGESSVALAGGVNLVVSPESTVAMSKFGAMAPDGRSKAFDARANGYVRGEGAGIVVLKPLSRALADGDRVYCVIRGSAMNNDGFSNGLTAPNPEAQEQVLRLAYARANVDVHDVQYVETHGTGTLLGDPIEAGALGAVLGSGRDAARPLLIGSVKTNIGHLEAAAGMAGFVKVALSIHHDRIPPSLHFQKPNPHIRFDDLRLRVQTALGSWPAADRPALAGVSAFGFGGTNCHIVVEAPRDREARLFPVAADTTEALRRAALDWRERVDRIGAMAALEQACVAASAPSPIRAGVTYRTDAELARKLGGLGEGQIHEGVASGRASAERRRVVFVCSGHGSQWQGMGRALLHDEPAFRAKFLECAAAIQAAAGWNPVDEMLADAASSRLDDIDIAQPLIFALQVALAALWRSWGIEPDAVVGHSMGEASAACISEAITLDEAVRVICHRSRLLKRTSGQGLLAVIGLSRQESQRAIDATGKRLWVAACNSPASTAISGEPDAVRELVAGMEAQGTFARLVNVNVSPHGPSVDPLRAELFEVLKDVKPGRSAVRFLSTVSGSFLPGESLGASYWVRNIREPVLFADAVASALEQGYSCFVELSGHPVLLPAIEQSIAHVRRDAIAIASLRRGDESRVPLLESAARLFTDGMPICWPAVSGVPSGRAERPAPIVVSAHSRAALSDAARALAGFVRSGTSNVVDVAFTTAMRRTHLEHRACAVGASREEVADQLDAVAQAESRPGLSVGQAIPGGPRLAWVFCGQGPQSPGMGLELARTEPVFRRTLEECDARLKQLGGWSLIDELAAPAHASRIDRMEIAQPAIFSIQAALAALWRSWGVVPDAVIGHSMGEVASAHAAGILPLEDAIKVIFHRGRIIQQAAGKGRMAAIELAADETQALIAPYGDRVAIAAANGPLSTIVSGEPAAVTELVQQLTARGVFCRELRVDFASHCPQMDPLQDQLASALAGLTPRQAATPIFSTVTGAQLDPWEFDASYWARNLRQPVLFSAAMNAALAAGFDTYVEIGPHPILGGSIGDCGRARDRSCIALPSMKREQGELATMMSSAGALFTAGRTIAWPALMPQGGRTISLPPYAWQRERHWIDVRSGREAARAASAKSIRTLHGGRADTPLPTFEARLSVAAPAYLGDHRLLGHALVPAAVFLEMASGAAAEAFGRRGVAIENVDVRDALFLPDEGDVDVQTVFSPAEQGDRFQIFSRAAAGEGWRLHAAGVVRTGQPTIDGRHDLAVLRKEAGDAVDTRAFYERMRAEGLELGPAFQRIDALWRRDGVALARIPVSPEFGERYGGLVHPAILDAALHAVAAARPQFGGAPSADDGFVMVGLERIVLETRVRSTIWTHVVLREHAGGRTFAADVELLSDEGTVIGRVDGLRLRTVNRAALVPQRHADAVDALFRIVWTEQPAEATVGARPPLDAAVIAQAVSTRVSGTATGVEPTAIDIGLESLATTCALEALRSLGWTFATETTSTDELAQRLGVVDRHRRLFVRLLDMLAEDGVLTRAGSYWTVRRPPAFRDTAAEVARLSSEHPEYGAELALVERCGRNLAGVLRGSVDPLLLIFPDGSLESARKLYEDSPLSRTCNRAVREAVADAAARVGGPLRVLEIGAGTGATTSHVLPALPAGSKYVFTDVSTVFLSGAQARFGDGNGMAYQLLDIERVPSEQGFAGQQFDIVIAANVLHATANLRETVDHVRQLLAPGGLLVAVEGTRPTRWIDLVFGMTTGWWRFADDVRTDYPLISAERWMRVLADAQFATADSLTEVDTHGANAAGRSAFAEAVIFAGVAGDAAVRQSGRWLLFADAAGVAEAVGRRLEACGDECVTVPAPSSFADAAASSAAERALDDYLANAASKRGVVYAWGAATAVDDRTSVETVEDATHVCDGLMRVVQRLAPRADTGRVWVVTRGAQAVTSDETASPVAAMLWGLGRVAAAEHRELWGGLIDVDPKSTDAVAIANEITTAREGVEVALRSGSRFVPQLGRLDLAGSSAARIRPDASYLITGGLGDLGVEVARWFAEHGARRLVLVGRSPLPPRAEWPSLDASDRATARARAIESMEALGAEVRYETCDIADAGQIAGVVQALSADGWPPIAGVVHAAGVIDDALIAANTPDRFHAVARSKAVGAWQLHRALRDAPLEFFVLFSSIGSVLGHGGQSSYAAANALLDALAHHRRAAGRPAVSVNWAGWRDLGFATSAGGRLVLKDLEHHGIGTLTGAQALDIFGRVLGSTAAQVIATPIDFARVRDTAAGASLGILTTLAAQAGSRSPEPVRAKSLLRHDLQAASPTDRRALLESCLRDEVARVLSTSPSRIDERKPLGTMGLDSLMALELRNRLEALLAVKLSTTFVFNHPTIVALVAHLASRMDLALDEPMAGSAATAAPVEKLDPVLAGIDGLSEDEALKALLGGARGTA